MFGIMIWLTQNKIRTTEKSDITFQCVREGFNGKRDEAPLTDEYRLSRFLNPSKLLQLGLRNVWKLQVFYPLLGHHVLLLAIVHNDRSLLLIW
jgi:hypothetical protein